jgi:UDP-N-acetylmuramoyl-L-alanyl-D-glutamate--2,6-diaminopimelate ligase
MIKLIELLDAVSHKTLLNPEALEVLKSRDVVEITSDSRQAREGTIFVALQGEHTDGHQYLPHALNAGVVAVVGHGSKLLKAYEEAPDFHANTLWIQVEEPYMALAQLSAKIAGYPGHHLKLVGVTGTNGKTTVTHLIERMLQDAGRSVGLIGTLGQKSTKASGYHSTGHTTPMAPELQNILADMQREKMDYVVMEVSSHALDQHRVAECDFQVAVWTNLTQDHLDYHKTMGAYCSAKCKLFSGLTPSDTPRYAVINLDDPAAPKFIEACPQGTEIFTYSLKNPEASIYAQNVSFSIEGATFDVVTPQGSMPVKLQIAGEFSIYNALAALGGGLALQLALKHCVQALQAVPGIRGRFEVIHQQPYVIVDYAHTPDGLENILKAARFVLPTGGKLITVFGCGGDRDTTKRPQMGHIAETMSDTIVVTSDNPRTEDPQQIITDILAGIQRFDSTRMFVSIDREQAIHQAIAMAKVNDIVVIAGKGHEDYQILADRIIHFDDKEVVKHYFDKTQSVLPS